MKCLVIMKPQESLQWKYVTKSPADLHGAVKRSHLLSKSPAVLCRCLWCSKILLTYKFNFLPSWTHLHSSKGFQEHLRILLQSRRILCLAPGGLGCISMDLGAFPRSTGVSSRFTYTFCTAVHFPCGLLLREWLLIGAWINRRTMMFNQGAQ